MRQWKSFKSWAGVLGLLVVVSGAIYFFTRHSPLNVVVVTLDTTRADRIGCYGYQNARTPALDTLAKKGVLFEQACVPVPVTLPSHASMFTGLYPPEHGLHHNGRGKLPDSVPVLAEILKKRNYETGAFIASYVLDSKFGLNRGFETYDDAPVVHSTADDHHFPYRSGKTVMDAALNWLGGRASHPFFCWIHLYDAHAPYQSRPEIFQDAFADRPYDAGIAFADQQLQRLLTFLSENHFDRQTLVIVVGDHGEGLMEHEEVEHGMQLYNTTLRVPLVIFDPRQNRAGHRVQSLVSAVDLMPTILDCLNVPIPSSISGHSLKAALSGEESSSRAYYAETDVPYMYSRWSPLFAVLNDRWKYIKTKHEELYDLSNDPLETHNLASAEPDRCREMENLLQNLIDKMKRRETETVSLTGAEQNILKSLGYVAAGSSPKSAQQDAKSFDIKEMMPYYNLIEYSRREVEHDDPDKAIQIVRDVVEKVPDYLAARLALGIALMRKKDFSEAASIFASIIAEQPDFVEAYAEWGNALASQDQFADAVPRYRKALELDSSSERCRLSLADALAHSGRPGEAVKELEQVIRSNPSEVEARLKLGGLMAQGGRIKEAISQFESAIKDQPDCVIAHANLGSLYAREGRFDRAVLHASKAVKIDPESFEARYTLGAIFLVQKNYPKAVAEFTEACKLRPDEPSARQQLLHAQTALKVTPP